MVRRRNTSVVALAMVVLGLVAAVGGLVAAPGAGADSPSIYLALGDSVPVWNGTSSYPYLIAAHYATTNPNLQVVDMACSGETTDSMIANSLCAPAPDDSQVKEATAFLQAHQGQVALVTIDIGGNDLLPCVNGFNVDLGCIQQTESTMVQNLGSILSDIRQAAGPTVPVVGMNYYDPFLGDWLAGGSVQVLANLSVSVVTNLNTLLAGAYQAASVPVADVAAAFHTTDLTDQVSSPWGQVPVAVHDACTLLDITCTAGQAEGFGDDPNNDGAKVIAQAFEQTIGASIMPVPTSTTTSLATTTSTPTTSTPTPSTPTTSTSTTSTSTSTTLTTSTSTTASGGGGPTSTVPPVVTASSGSLAFTGAGRRTGLVALAGALLAALGGMLLAAMSLPDRLSSLRNRRRR